MTLSYVSGLIGLIVVYLLAKGTFSVLEKSSWNQKFWGLGGNTAIYNTHPNSRPTHTFWITLISPLPNITNPVHPPLRAPLCCAFLNCSSVS